MCTRYDYGTSKKEAFKAKKDNRFRVEYEYEFLREAFGVEKKEYKLFADFKRKTIEPAVKEIYDKTEMNIYDVAYGKTGRAVSRIAFSIEMRNKAEAEARAVQIHIEDQPKEGNQKKPQAKATHVENFLCFMFKLNLEFHFY